MVMKNLNEVIAKLIDLRFIQGPGVKVQIQDHLFARYDIKSAEYDSKTDTVILK